MTKSAIEQELRAKANAIFKHAGECVGADSALLMIRAADCIANLRRDSRGLPFATPGKFTDEQSY